MFTLLISQKISMRSLKWRKGRQLRQEMKAKQIFPLPTFFQIQNYGRLLLKEFKCFIVET